MVDKINKSKHKIRNIILVLLAIAVIACAGFLIFMTIHDNQRHSQLQISMTKLQNDLKAQGIKAKRESGCARLQQEMWKGPKHCFLGSQYSTSSRTDYLHTADAYISSLAKINNFSSTTNALTNTDIKDFSNYHDEGYLHTPTGSKCDALYQYIKTTKKYKIQFSCDDTSWFVKTFQG